MHKREKIDYLACTISNDIPSKKRFGYRELRIIGWVAMSCLVLGSIFTNTFVLNIRGSDETFVAGIVLSSLGSLALPAFFIANFSIIITQRNNYKSLFIRYFSFVGLMFIIIFCFLYRYMILLNWRGSTDFFAACEALTRLLNGNPSFGTCFNMFIDLSLMLSIWYFIEYTPRKHFRGKNLKYFRLLAIIPITYELVCLVLKTTIMFSSSLVVPFYIFPFLTNKPPVLFFVFMAIVVREKLQERKYLSLGHSKKEYQQYLKTNASSKTFSRFIAIAFFIAAIVDLAVYLVAINAIASDTTISQADAIKMLIKLGVGKGFSFIFAIPIIFFYSYNKKYKETKIDIIIPVAGTVVVGLIILETIFDLIFN